MESGVRKRGEKVRKTVKMFDISVLSYYHLVN